MSNQRKVALLVAVLIVSVFAMATPAAAQSSSENVSITDTTVQPSASNGSVDVVADIPNGIQTINLTVSLDDTSVADLDGVSDEAGFGTGFQEDAGESTTDTNTFRAADFGTVSADEDQTLFSVDLTNFSGVGSSSDISVTVNSFTNDNGNSVIPSTSVGQITVAPESDETTDVGVVMDSAPSGLQTYNLTVSTTSETTILSVAPDYLTGSSFQNVSGGSGSDSVTVRGADLAQRSFTEPKVLVNITYAGNISSSDIELTVNEATNADGNSIAENIRKEVSQPTGNPFSGPIAGNMEPPVDPDGDGLYEDVNGDGDVAFDDAVSIAFAGDLTEAQQSALDFDNDGDVDFDDAVALAFSS